VRAPAVYAPAFSWTGCYIGGFVGGAWGGDVTVTDLNGYIPPLGHAFSHDLDSGFIGGGTLGCNWQPVGSPFVVGIEGELGFLNLEGSALDPLDPRLPQNLTSTTKIGDWYGMITGRLGVTWDRTLLYVKGGVAFVDVENTIADPLPAGSGLLATSSNGEATWTVGAGIEWAFAPQWSVKAEYMFIGLDGNDQACGALAVAGTFCWNHDVDGIHTAKVGMNWRWGP
jgi:outer membrane immunogenic protein